MIITTGDTRIVFVFNSFVIKIPNFTYSWKHFLQGLISNLNEGKSWKASKHHWSGDISYLLCSVIWYSWGGWMLIMKRAKVCNNEEKIDYTIWEKNHFWDNKPLNFGYYNGVLVKIDYA